MPKRMSQAFLDPDQRIGTSLKGPLAAQAMKCSVVQEMEERFSKIFLLETCLFVLFFGVWFQQNGVAY